jgi:hypothetical protein
MEKSINQNMKKQLLLAAAAVALICSCVPSVNPFYSDKEVVTDARFAGIWLEDADKDQPVRWKFTATTNSAYAVVLTEDKGATGNFEGHLFKLGGEFFFDFTPTECNYATNQAGMVGAAMIPGHLLLRVTFAEKKLKLALCDPDWLKKFLEKSPAAIAHREVDGGIFLTAETGALQKFVLQHLGKGELFSEGTDYRRQTDAAAPK